MNLRIAGLAVLAVGIGWCGHAAVAEAHLRDSLLNQSYYTAKRGEVEVELWNDMYFPEADNDDTYHSTHQVELEYGLTDHVQLAYYEVYTWDRAQDWERDAFKVEVKARLAEAGQWPVDVALYTEYKNPDGHRGDHSDELEQKLIVSKDLGPWNVIANAIVEKKLNTGDAWELAYTAGASYGLGARTRLGVEVKQELGGLDALEFNGRTPFYIAPVLAASLTPHIRVVAGPVFGMTRASDDVQLRSIVEVEF